MFGISISGRFCIGFVLEKMWAGQIQSVSYDYGQFAGLPAGEGIPKLTNIEQYNNSEGIEYVTFRTSDIFPLDAYRLKSSSDATDTKYRRKGRLVSSGVVRWNTYGKKAGFKRYLFNRYYLVKLPDGNYVAAFLDDGVYLRYRLHWKCATSCWICYIYERWREEVTCTLYHKIWIK